MAAVETPFRAAYGTGAEVSPAAASASATITTGHPQVELSNLGVNVCYVRTGLTAATATTADVCVPPGTSKVMTIPAAHDKLAYISAGGTTLHYILGEGW